MNTFRFVKRFVGGAGLSQNVGRVGLVLRWFEGSLRHVTCWLLLPDLVSGGEESFVHETLSFPSVIAGLSLPLTAAVPAGGLGRGEGRGWVGLI